MVNVGGTATVVLVSPEILHPSYVPLGGIATGGGGAGGGALPARVNPAFTKLMAFEMKKSNPYPDTAPITPAKVPVQYTPWYVNASARTPNKSKK
jgi:hypothetical protein